VFYRLVRTLIGFGLRLFYRVTVQHLPDDTGGPVMFVGNHPNALLDGAMIFIVTRRQVTFLAKEPLFRMPVIGRILKGMGALPVYRKQDNAQMANNEGMFEAAAGALQRGGAITLFPEGKSHSEPGLASLKTGAARIALRAAKSGADVRIIPIGLTYAEKHRFRSEVLIDADPAIPVAPLVPSAGADEAAAVRELTARIEAGLRRVMLDLESWEDLPLIKTAEELYALKLGERLNDPERVRRFVQGVRILRAEQPERFNRLRKEVVNYRRRLELVGTSPKDLAIVYRRSQVWAFALRNLANVVVGLPVVAAGLALFAIPFNVPRWLNRALNREVDQQATIKFAGALLMVPLVVGAIWYVGWRLGGAPVAVGGVAAALPLALVTRYFLEHWREVARDVSVFFTLGNRASLKARLVSQGEQLAAEIEAVAAELRPRLTPEDLHGRDPAVGA
jgi:1-acyl-sn-glycerol-3-phosphate acyltransferase